MRGIDDTEALMITLEALMLPAVSIIPSPTSPPTPPPPLPSSSSSKTTTSSTS